MFEVEIHQNKHYWNRFMFRFETLEEAQQFVASALNHYVHGEEEDEDDSEYMIVDIRYSQKFSTAKEESDESSISD